MKAIRDSAVSGDTFASWAVCLHEIEENIEQTKPLLTLLVYAKTR